MEAASDSCVLKTDEHDEKEFFHQCPEIVLYTLWKSREKNMYII